MSAAAIFGEFIATLALVSMAISSGPTSLLVTSAGDGGFR